MLGFLTMTLPAREVMRLDLEGAKKQAILYNKTLKNAGMAVDKSVYQLKEAISAGLPQVSSTLDYTNALGPNFPSGLWRMPSHRDSHQAHQQFQPAGRAVVV